MEGKKDDQTKVRLDLLSIPALLGLGNVLTHGAIKYEPRNWEAGIQYGRVFGAVLRHLFAWWLKEDYDKDSGLHHIDHAMCELMFLSHYVKAQSHYQKFDDRPLWDKISDPTTKE